MMPVSLMYTKWIKNFVFDFSLSNQPIGLTKPIFYLKVVENTHSQYKQYNTI